MEKTVHSAKPGSFQRNLRTTKSLKQDEPEQRLILKQRLALVRSMERELKKHRKWCSLITFPVQ